MIQFDQWWMPDGETQLPAEMTTINVRVEGRLTWQYHKYAAALALLPLDRRRVAVDVGAHVGLWSYWMLKDFAYLHAFEPVAAHRKCWVENTWGICIGDCVALYDCALGSEQTLVNIVQTAGESGGAHINIAGGADVEQYTLDAFDLPIVDLLKIDVEGYEAAVIAGARETITRCRPIIVVEDVARNNARYGFDGHVAGLLRSLGMKLRVALGSDTIWEW